MSESIHAIPADCQVIKTKELNSLRQQLEEAQEAIQYLKQSNGSIYIGRMKKAEAELKEAQDMILAQKIKLSSGDCSYAHESEITELQQQLEVKDVRIKELETFCEDLKKLSKEKDDIIEHLRQESNDCDYS